MSKSIPIPQITFPSSWVAAAHEWRIPDSETMRAAFHSPTHALHSLAKRDHAEDIAIFADQLFQQLAASQKSVIIDYPPSASTAVACMLVGELLGGIHNSDSPFSAAADVDVTTDAPPRQLMKTFGVENQYVMDEQYVWHTDGAPWLIPNRWSIVGITYLADDCEDTPTGLLPFDRLLQRSGLSPEMLTALRTEPVNWRQMLPGLEPISMPILGSCNRWLPIIPPCKPKDQTKTIDQACHKIIQALLTTDIYETILRRGKLLILDNHHTIHRARVSQGPEKRRIARIRVGGEPGY